MSRISPTATPPAAIFAFMDMSVASFAAPAALCSENGPPLPAVPHPDPETSLSRTPSGGPRRAPKGCWQWAGCGQAWEAGGAWGGGWRDAVGVGGRRDALSRWIRRHAISSARPRSPFRSASRLPPLQVTSTALTGDEHGSFEQIVE
ncbi:hypothetical protein GCM10010300_48490 [Streptomyces olivaceoviridis]|nr:hypothetical protein GCM10010300_48490 [Streptomyces olivaceoviridis]